MAFQLSEIAARNRILLGLDDSDAQLIHPLLREVSFSAGTTILSPLRTYDCLFIESGVVSLLCEPDGMPPVEVGLVGSEGMLGLPALLGASAVVYTAATLTRCDALAIASSDLQRMCDRSPQLRKVLLRYVNARLEQVMKRSACHLQHRLEQRLADWIITATDRLQTPRITITHRQLSELLGATRPGVTLAVQELEGRRAIRATRKLITVRSRALLANIACGCYGIREQHHSPPCSIN